MNKVKGRECALGNETEIVVNLAQAVKLGGVLLSSALEAHEERKATHRSRLNLSNAWSGDPSQLGASVWRKRAR